MLILNVKLLADVFTTFLAMCMPTYNKKTTAGLSFRRFNLCDHALGGPCVNGLSRPPTHPPIYIYYTYIVHTENKQSSSVTHFKHQSPVHVPSVARQLNQILIHAWLVSLWRNPNPIPPPLSPIFYLQSSNLLYFFHLTHDHEHRSLDCSYGNLLCIVLSLS